MYEYDSPFFIIRTPLLPYGKLEKYLFGQEKITADELKEILEGNGLVEEAVYFASRNFLNSLNDLFNAENSRNSETLINSFLSYYIRMCSRSTPFALFAGMTSGEWANETKIELAKNRQIRRHLRIDMEFLCDSVEAIFTEKSIAEKLRYFPNNTLYFNGDNVRYFEKKNTLESSKYAQRQKYYDLVDVDSSDELKAVVERAQNGTSFTNLLNVLVEMGYEEAESNEYLHQLIESKVLISEAEPHISGRPYVDYVKDKLLELNHEKAIPLANILNEISEINNTTEVERSHELLERYKRISVQLKDFSVNAQAGKNIFQMDMFRPGIHTKLNKKVIWNLTEAIRILYRLGNKDIHKSPMAQFERAFYDRYENAIIPLTEALDPEIGIGYSKQQTYASNLDSYRPLMSPFKFNKITQVKTDLFLNALKKGKTTVDLIEEGMLDKIPEAKSKSMPNEISALVSVFHDEDNQLVTELKYATRSSSVRYLGRFSYNTEIKEKIDLINAYEEEKHPDKVFAEIVHFPKDRIGNIAVKEQLRDFEIPIVTPSTITGENQINITDLYLLFRNGKMILWSKKLNKEVVPRLGVAHNYNFRSLSVYHFLCDYQYHYEDFNVQWDWEHLGFQEFLPRVTYKNTILSPATWNILTTEIKKIPLKTKEEKRSYIDLLRKEKGVPRFVTLKSGGSNLVLDLENINCIEILVKRFKKYELTTVLENLWSSYASVTSSAEGSYTNEFIVPLLKNNVRPQYQDPKLTAIFNNFEINTVSDVQRKFPPGSEWYYAKIYVTRSFLEKLLLELYGSVIGKLMREGIITKWFFIRYRDPKHHLRIRLLLKNTADLHLVSQEINAVIGKYLNQGEVRSICNDTYSRELERFGKYNMEFSETLFWKNSDLVVRMIHFLNQYPSQKVRFLLCVYGVDALYKSFGIDLNERHKMFENINNSFAAGIGKEQKLRIRSHTRRNFKEDLKVFERLMFYKDEDLNPKELQMRSFFEHSKKEMEEISEKISKRLAEDKMELERILNVYSHLFINRIINKGTTFWEPLAYHYLAKITKSFIVRNKQIVEEIKE